MSPRRHEPEQLRRENDQPPGHRSHRPEDDGTGADMVGGIAQLHESYPVTHRPEGNDHRTRVSPEMTCLAMRDRRGLAERRFARPGPARARRPRPEYRRPDQGGAGVAVPPPPSATRGDC